VYLLCLFWAALLAVAQDRQLRPLVGEELASVNLRFLLRGPMLPSPEIVILAIDERSYVADTFRDDEEILRRCPDLGLLDRFPFKRRVYASAMQRLHEAGAKVIALDLLFLQPTSKDEDQWLQSAIERYRDQVVIGCNFSDEGRKLGEPPETVVPTNVPMRSVAGYVNYWPDSDRFVRRARFATYESAEARVDRYPGEEPWLSFDALAVRKFKPVTPIPDARQDIYINFAGPPGAFPSYEFYKIFYDRTWQQELKNGDVFRDRIVLIGPVGNFQHDTRPTPFGSPQEMPGVEIHAATIATLLHGDTYHDAPRWVGLLTIFVLGLVAALLLNLHAHPLLKMALLLGGCLAYFGVAVSAFTRHNLVLLAAAPLWTMAGGGVGGIAVQLVVEQWEKLRVRQTLERYVSKPVADEILRHGEMYEASLGGERRAITVLFADIRGFTTLSEQADPAEIVHQLNEYFTAMTEIVMKHEGTLSKFIGDEIMAIFGAPLTAGAAEDAWRAVQTAYEMRTRLGEMQQVWISQHRPPLRIGVGINHGEVLVGNIGSPHRMEYTVIGDAVNVASRIEKLNKEFSTDILLTESVYELVKDRVEVQRIGAIAVRGRQKELTVYSLKSL
jgi:adenylate cyclase